MYKFMRITKGIACIALDMALAAACTGGVAFFSNWMGHDILVLRNGLTKKTEVKEEGK